MNSQNVNPVEYESFTADSVNYRSSQSDKGFLIEKQLNSSSAWVTVGVAENKMAVDKYKSILNNMIPDLSEDMKNKLLNAIVSRTTINDMLKQNRKRSTGLLDSLMKRL